MARTHLILGTLGAVLALSGLAVAAPKPKDEPLPPVVQAVADCRTLQGDAERLACYDRGVAAMLAAREKHDLVVADRETVRETKRGLFGLTLPKLRLFGGTEGDDVQQIETTIGSVRMAKDGFAVLELADGAHWKQTDGPNQYAKPGQKIKIRRAALGSFLANIGSGPAVRVIRLAQ